MGYSNKYHAVPTEVDGIKFASRAEARRYQELQIMESSGSISELQVHKEYLLMVNGYRICKYVCDFKYVDHETGKVVVEDVKGVLTAVYKLKKKLMYAVLGIEVQEVTA